jgi:hypothetical protein
MRTEVRICFDSSKIPGGASAILGPAGCGPDVATVEDVPALRQVEVSVRLEETDLRVPVLRDLLARHGRRWLELHEDRYTEEELDGARLLVMHPNRQCEIDGGVAWGMTYDFSMACPACGTGARQTSAVFVNGEQVSQMEGHRAGATYFFHLLVDEGLASQLEAANISGLSFRGVYAVMPDQRQVRLRWRQLCAERILPPMSPRTSGLVRERACPVCQRNGYFQTDAAPTRLVYRASDLRDIDDVNMSWENLGFAVLKPDLRESLLSYPWTLVTPKVRRVFRDAGVTSFEWLPVRVEEDGA